MTATNHALTGAAIGFIVGEPIIAIPAAVLSHFVCDAIPHFRTKMFEQDVFKSNWFEKYLIAEFILCVLIVAIIVLRQPHNWQLAAICAFAAAAPDLLSYNRYQKGRHGKKWRPGLYVRFASGIQWFERPIGAVVEVAWFIAAIIVLVPFLR